jgi:hypothetical protein
MKYKLNVLTDERTPNFDNIIKQWNVDEYGFVIELAKFDNWIIKVTGNCRFYPILIE